MTKFALPSFTVPSPATEQYRQHYEQIFGVTCDGVLIENGEIVERFCNKKSKSRCTKCSTNLCDTHGCRCR
jgi:hypothetical protein